MTYIDRIERFVQADESGLEAYEGHLHLKRLGWLSAFDLGRIAHSENLRAIRRLSLSKNGLDPEGARALSSSEHGTNIRVLELDECKLDAGVLAGLTHGPALTKLKTLTLRKTNLDAACATILSPWVGLRSLESLDLSRCDLGDEGTRILFSSPLFSSLRALFLEFNRIGDEGATALARAHNLAGLKKLTLFYNQIASAGFQALARSPLAQELEELDLHSNRIDERAFEVFSGPGPLGHSFRELRALDLGGNRTGDRGAARLARCPGLEKLETLRIGDGDITDDGAVVFLHTVLERLRAVHLVDSDLGEEIIAVLSRRFPVFSPREPKPKAQQPREGMEPTTPAPLPLLEADPNTRVVFQWAEEGEGTRGTPRALSELAFRLQDILNSALDQRGGVARLRGLIRTVSAKLVEGSDHVVISQRPDAGTLDFLMNGTETLAHLGCPQCDAYRYDLPVRRVRGRAEDGKRGCCTWVDWTAGEDALASSYCLLCPQGHEVLRYW